MTTEGMGDIRERIAKIGADSESEDEPVDEEPQAEEEPADEEVTPFPEPEEVPGLEEEEEPSAEAEGEEVPVYLMDEEPEGKSNWAKWALMHGMTEEEVEARGINASTVRICAQELERDGYRQRPSKEKPSSTAVAKRGTTTEIKTFAKGAPPEALINAIDLPLDGNEARVFEKGLKTGASLLVLAVRVVQELSAIGIQQTKPLIDMSKSMREGEAMAAKTAATEAAQEAAMNVSKVFSPHLASLEGAIDGIKQGGQDPVQAMMVRTMEPLIQNMMKMFMPGAKFPSTPGGQDWQVVSE